MQQIHFYHSPFSEKTSFSEKDKALLLSFALSELFACTNLTCKTWMNLETQEKKNAAPLDKLIEHASLLMRAFPSSISSMIEMKENTSHLLYCLQKNISFSTKERLQEIFLLLEPLIKICHADENFLYFLLSHHKEIDWLLDSCYLSSFLKEFYSDLSHLHTHLCDYFHKRGFTRLLPEISFFLEQIQKRNPV